MPERIQESRAPYFEELQAADRQWEAGQLDCWELANYLEGLLIAQLKDEDEPPENGIVADG